MRDTGPKSTPSQEYRACNGNLGLHRLVIDQHGGVRYRDRVVGGASRGRGRWGPALLERLVLGDPLVEP